MKSTAVSVCLIEDDELMGEALCERFEMEAFDYKWYKQGKEALKALQRHKFGVVVSDIRLPDLSGEELFLRLRQSRADCPPFLFMTGYGVIDQAVRLLKLGAADYIAKPLDVDDLVQRMRELAGPLDEAAPASFSLGMSSAMRHIEQTLGRLAGSDCTVLITGESGVGKERVAQFLHELSDPDASTPFVAVNCGAIPESLMEAELFGFEKGAFTGAVKRRHGYFEQADNGTLFLDEVGDMPLSMQVKLLRAIQERYVTRVGGETPIPSSARIVCATHQELAQRVESGDFREDLYYRINVIHLRIPPLRERREDILWLARQFAEEQSNKKGGPPFHFNPDAERALLSYAWPGNIRELKHCIERACILADRPRLDPEILSLGDSSFDETTLLSGDSLVSYLDSCEKRYIEQALAGHNWRITDTADDLGISRKNLWQKMRKHQIATPDK
jgi:DNA-binding NtrC family response regulator